MLGCEAWKASITCCVCLFRRSLPHQVKRTVTFPPLSVDDAGVQPAASMVTVAAAASVLSTMPERREVFIDPDFLKVTQVGRETAFSLREIIARAFAGRQWKLENVIPRVLTGALPRLPGVEL